MYDKINYNKKKKRNNNQKKKKVLRSPTLGRHSESESVSCSAVSDSSQPHGLQPIRFLCPWNFPGKNTEVAIPFSRGSSWPRDWTQVSWIAGRFFTIWAKREAPLGHHSIVSIKNPLRVHCCKVIKNSYSTITPLDLLVTYKSFENSPL